MSLEHEIKLIYTVLLTKHRDLQASSYTRGESTEGPVDGTVVTTVCWQLKKAVALKANDVWLCGCLWARVHVIDA